MKVGFRSTCSPEHLDTAERLGFEVLELMWEDYAWKHREEILRNVRNSRIDICAMVMGVERTFEELKDDIEYAVEIGAKVLVIHPHFVDPQDGEYVEEFMERYAKGVAYAIKRNVDVAMPSCWHGPLSWDTAFSLLPELKLKHDPSFSYQAGRNYRMELVKYGPRIVYVHAKDEMLMERTTDYCDGLMKFNYAPAGMGDIHWGSVIALLYEARYKGDICIEPHNTFWCGDVKFDQWKSSEWNTCGSDWERGLILAKRHLEQFIVD